MPAMFLDDDILSAMGKPWRGKWEAMSGPINEDISVERDAVRLLAFSWQGERYPVSTYQVLGTPPTRWWDGESERTFMRVTARGCLYELYFDHDRQTWVLARRLS